MPGTPTKEGQSSRKAAAQGITRSTAGQRRGSTQGVGVELVHQCIVHKYLSNPFSHLNDYTSHFMESEADIEMLTNVLGMHSKKVAEVGLRCWTPDCQSF